MTEEEKKFLKMSMRLKIKMINVNSENKEYDYAYNSGISDAIKVLDEYCYKLKLCTTCGKEPKLIDYYIKGTANHKNYFVKCECGKRTRNRKRIIGAVTEWNEMGEGEE